MQPTTGKRAVSTPLIVHSLSGLCLSVIAGGLADASLSQELKLLSV